MKFLTICDGGNVRSAALAYVLKWERRDLGHEAIAAGRLHLSPETMEMLCDWADVIVVMQPHMDESVPIDYRRKVYCVDVGPDRWGIYIHPELLEMVREGADFLVKQTA